MTAIELYDEYPIENFVSLLCFDPDKIIYLGRGERLRRLREKVEQQAELQLRIPELEFIGLDDRSHRELHRILREIVLRERDCRFDVTGGSAEAMLALGEICGEFRGDETVSISVVRMDITTGVFHDWLNDCVWTPETPPEVSIADLVSLHGGRIYYKDLNEEPLEMLIDPELIEDVNVMWSICKKNPSQWNVLCGALARMYKDRRDQRDTCRSEMTLLYNETRAIHVTLSRPEVRQMLYELRAHRLLTGLDENQRAYRVEYKNNTIRRILTTSGALLELKIFTAAISLKDGDGLFYNAAATGVYIDWDGVIHTGQGAYDTENEIDVILIRGFLPVFISCKNGACEPNEAYKLLTVAKRFGGPCARAALVYSACDDAAMEHAIQRATDMGILAVGPVAEMSDETLREKLRELAEKF